jgi:hypothetical protein
VAPLLHAPTRTHGVRRTSRTHARTRIARSRNSRPSEEARKDSGRQRDR